MSHLFSRWSLVLLSGSLVMLYISLFVIHSADAFLIQWEVMAPSTPLMVYLILDPVGALTSSVVLFISSNVVLFAKAYMGTEPFKKRFLLIVLTFIMAMNLLVFIPHLMVLLLGWDGLGVSSYLLVIYYQNSNSMAAGIFTMLTNRIGDALLLIAIALSSNTGHWNILLMKDNFYMHSFMALAIMLAAMTKSAQMPFSGWLPAAMAAPTPVSALVHSSTLVTAGVFLLIRFYPFLQAIKWFSTSLLFISVLTMTMAGVAAILETDLKKIIALSTLSQLGVMMSAIALSKPLFATFHLLTHALFKALLFICAGTLISYSAHSQDFRTMGSMANRMPVTMSAMLIANMALCGFPFMAGFYSKDFILESSIYFGGSGAMTTMIYASATLTAAYSARMMMAGLMSPLQSYPVSNLNNSNNSLSCPSTFLSLGAIMGGALMNWFFCCPIIPMTLPSHIKLLASFMAIFGVALVTLTLKDHKKKCPLMAHDFLVKMWFIAPLTTQLLVGPALKVSVNSLAFIDQSWIESSVQKSMGGLLLASAKMIRWQDNSVVKVITASIFTVVIFALMQ